MRYLLLVLMCAGCSNQAVYDTVMVNRRNECLREPSARYVEECLARTRMTYQEYQGLVEQLESE